MEEFVAGSIGGAMGIVVGHPFDTMKVRIQNAGIAGAKGSGPLYNGAFDCARKIIAQEGTKGLFKGLMPPIVSMAPINSVIFGTYGILMRMMADENQGRNDRQPLTQVAIAGAGAGAAGTFITSPVELVKIRLQNGNPATGLPYKGPWDCMKQIVKREGGLSLARGIHETLLRETISFAFYFGAYEATVRQFTAPGEAPSPLAVFTAGAVSGVVVWGPVYPIDVIKTRVQSCDGKLDLSPSNMYRVGRDIYAKEGVSPFFRGFNTAMLRAVPVNAVTFMIFEACMQVLTHPEGMSAGLAAMTNFGGAAATSATQ